MKRTRIKKEGHEQYVIQQKHFIFFWLWVDAWINSSAGAYCIDTFDTLEEAESNLHYFDGSKITNEGLKTI